MNQTETLAFEYLKQKGYKGIRKTVNPDFEANDGSRFEIKRLYGNKLLFYGKQYKSLKPADWILVFDGEKIIHQFQWKDLKKQDFAFTLVTEKSTIARIEKDLKEHIESKRIYQKETFSDILRRLLKLPQ